MPTRTSHRREFLQRNLRIPPNLSVAIFVSSAVLLLACGSVVTQTATPFQVEAPAAIPTVAPTPSPEPTAIPTEIPPTPTPAPTATPTETPPTATPRPTATPTSAPSPEPKNDCDYKGVEQYLDETDPLVQTMSTQSATIDALLDEAVENSNAMIDSSWREALFDAMSPLEDASLAIQGVTPPTVLIYVHAELRNEAISRLTAIGSLRYGIEELDQFALDIAMEEWDAAVEHNANATTEMRIWMAQCIDP